jgi:DNA-binding response OmpR family regulator
MRDVLIVEDHPQVCKILREILEAEGFRVSMIGDGSLVLPEIRRKRPDLVILDWGLPGMNGLDVCREIRRTQGLQDLPVLMLTSRNEEDDRVLGLEMGADDFVGKPFSHKELVARVRSLLRRVDERAPQTASLQAGPLTLNPANYQVLRDGSPLNLSLLEFRLLYFLASNKNLAFTREQLLDNIWGSERFVTPRSVDVYVQRLREKIESNPDSPLLLRTIRGVGYLFTPDHPDTP